MNPIQQKLVIPVFFKELVLHETLANIARTDYDRLVDIRVSNPYRADSTIVLSEQTRSIELPSKDVSRCTLLYQIDTLRKDMI